MKKIYFISILFILALLSINKAFSYEINFWWKWFYSSISDNYSDLNTKMYTIENQNWWGIIEKIKSEINYSCFSNLTEWDIKNIVNNTNIEKINKKVSPNCKDDKWNILQKSYLENIETIKKIYISDLQKAKEKSQKLLKLSSIWIYTDWNEENSPFDIVKDLERIDKLIFWEENIYDFEWDWYVDLKNEIKKLFENSRKKDEELELSFNLEEENKNSSNLSNSLENHTKNNHSTLCYLDWNCENYTEIQKVLCEINWNCNWEETTWYLSIKNDFNCKIDNSWLKNSSSAHIYWFLNNSDKINNYSETSNLWNYSNNLNNSNSFSNNNLSSSFTNSSNDFWLNFPWSYDKVDDKKFFSCDNWTFCIDVNFKTYNHKLLWWWSEQTPSILYLIERSNKHLKKFIDWSLAQTEMTTNNFELWFLNLDFSEIFSQRFQISTRPVPILYLPETKEDKWDYSKDNLEQKFYTAYGFNPNLKNDFSEFFGENETNNIALNSVWWWNTLISKKLEELEKYREDQIKKLKYDSNAILQKTKNWDLNSLIENFREVTIYTKTLSEYVTNLYNIIQEIKQIPEDKGRT